MGEMLSWYGEIMENEITFTINSNPEIRENVKELYIDNELNLLKEKNPDYDLKLRLQADDGFFLYCIGKIEDNTINIITNNHLIAETK